MVTLTVFMMCYGVDDIQTEAEDEQLRHKFNIWKHNDLQVVSKAVGQH